MDYKLKFVKISKNHEFAGVGFAGNIFIILNALEHITYSDSLYVDMETNECACTESEHNLFDTNNCWEYYFEQSPKDSYNSELDSLLPAKISYENRDIFLHPQNFTRLKEKFWKNFKLKTYLDESIKKFYNENIKDKKTLGVQIRLTDMKHYHNVSPIDSYITKIKEILIENPEIEQIFLSTDDFEIIETVKNSFEIPIIFYKDMFRANKETPHLNPYDRFHHNRELHRYNIGVECCQEIFTLSKCNFLLKADVSSISIVSIILSENIQKVYKV